MRGDGGIYPEIMRVSRILSARWPGVADHLSRAELPLGLLPACTLSCDGPHSPQLQISPQCRSHHFPAGAEVCRFSSGKYLLTGNKLFRKMVTRKIIPPYPPPRFTADSSPSNNNKHNKINHLLDTDPHTNAPDRVHSPAIGTFIAHRLLPTEKPRRSGTRVYSNRPEISVDGGS